LFAACNPTTLNRTNSSRIVACVLKRANILLAHSNLTETDPVKLWNYYLPKLVQAEEAFPHLEKRFLAIPTRSSCKKRAAHRGRTWFHISFPSAYHCLYDFPRPSDGNVKSLTEISVFSIPPPPPPSISSLSSPPGLTSAARSEKFLGPPVTNGRRA